MPTLAEACATLGVNRVTLRKWLARLKIRPEQDEYDTRFWLISDDAVEAIRTARGKMPPVRSPQPNLSEQIAPGIISPARQRKTRQQPLTASAPAGEGLPDGLVSVAEVLRTHKGMKESNIRLWRDQGDIECDPREFKAEHGGWKVNRPLTRRGMAQFYAKAVEWERAKTGRSFQRCLACPHEDEP